MRGHIEMSEIFPRRFNGYIGQNDAVRHPFNHEKGEEIVTHVFFSENKKGESLAEPQKFTYSEDFNPFTQSIPITGKVKKKTQILPVYVHEYTYHDIIHEFREAINSEQIDIQSGEHCYYYFTVDAKKKRHFATRHMRTGEWEIYFGNMKMSGKFKNDCFTNPIREGTWIFQIEAATELGLGLVNYVNGVKDGAETLTVTSKSSNNKIYFWGGNWKKGKLEGKIQIERNYGSFDYHTIDYVDGQISGSYMLRRGDKVVYKCEYLDGKKHGTEHIFRGYKEIANLGVQKADKLHEKHQRDLCETKQYQKGILNGISLSFFDDGSCEHLLYENGELKETTIESQVGRVKSKTNYQGSDRWTCACYHDNGAVKYIYSYKGDVLDGFYLIFDDEGTNTLQKLSYYKDGQPSGPRMSLDADRFSNLKFDNPETGDEVEMTFDANNFPETLSHCYTNRFHQDNRIKMNFREKLDSHQVHKRYGVVEMTNKEGITVDKKVNMENLGKQISPAFQSNIIQSRRSSEQKAL